MRDKGWVLLYAVGVVSTVLFLECPQGQGLELGGWFYPHNSAQQYWDVATQTAQGQTSLSIGDQWFNSDGSLVPGSGVDAPSFLNAMKTKKTQMPSFEFYVASSMAGVNRDEIWFSLLGNKTAIDTLVHNLASLCARCGYDGVTIDYEPSNPMPTPVQTKGLTYLLSSLRQRRLKVSIDISSNLDLWAQVYDFTALAPIVDRVELMNYYDYPQLPLPTALQRLYSHGFKPQQLILGVGLSSATWTNIPFGSKPEFPGTPHVHDGWVDSSYPQTGQYSSMPGQPTLWSDLMQLRQDNKIQMVDTGSIYYLWWPAAQQQAPVPEACTGPISVTYLNDPASMLRYCEFVKTQNLGGLFTWTTSSDSPNATASTIVADCLHTAP